MNLSETSQLLWAKLSFTNDDQWLPLHIHMSDAAQTAKLLWHNWVPFGTKQIINLPLLLAERLYVFLAAAHDLGKAIPAFQIAKPHRTAALENAKERILSSGLTCKYLASPQAIPHANASQIITECKQYGLPRELAVILGGHHGKPPSAMDINKASAYKSNLGLDDEKWICLQSELYLYAANLAEINVN